MGPKRNLPCNPFDDDDDEIEEVVAQTSSLLASELCIDKPPDSSTGKGSDQVLLGRIITCKPCGRSTITAVLNRAWKTSDSWSISEIRPGLFRLQFSLRRDLEAILNRGPWTVKGAQMVIKPWPKELNIEEVDFSVASFWVKLLAVPPAFALPANIKRYAGLFGKVDEGCLNRRNRFFPEVRFQVEVNLDKPLCPGFFLDRANLPPIWIQAKFENLGLLCYKCGVLGHEAAECLQDRECLIKKQGFKEVPKYGAWMDVRSRIPTCFTGGGRVPLPSTNVSSGATKERSDSGDVQRVEDTRQDPGQVGEDREVPGQNRAPVNSDATEKQGKDTMVDG